MVGFRLHLVASGGSSGATLGPSSESSPLRPAHPGSNGLPFTLRKPLRAWQLSASKGRHLRSDIVTFNDADPFLRHHWSDAKDLEDGMTSLRTKYEQVLTEVANGLQDEAWWESDFQALARE